jgi:hypothetical protein
MPQTETKDGHAHWYEKGNHHTDVTTDHWHPVTPGNRMTGPSVKVGHSDPEPGGHSHIITDPSEGFHRS